MRNPVVGRKNYYGSGSIWSARFTAVMFSIFETLQLWEINQLEWLSDYFRACALAGGKAPEDISIHLPWNLKERREKTWKYCGRVFSESELTCIRSFIDEDTSRFLALRLSIVCIQATIFWLCLVSALVHGGLHRGIGTSGGRMRNEKKTCTWSSTTQDS